MSSLLLAASRTPARVVSDVVHSTPFLIFRNVSLFLLATLWVSSVFWVLKDARRRIEDPFLVLLAVLVAAVPVLGLLLYLLLRPPEYAADVRERALEIRALELAVGTEAACPECGGGVRPEFLLCPRCATRLKHACAGCAAPLEPEWRACPRCATPRGPEREPLPAAAPGLVATLLARAREEEPEATAAAAPEAAPEAV